MKLTEYDFCFLIQRILHFSGSILKIWMHFQLLHSRNFYDYRLPADLCPAFCLAPTWLFYGFMLIQQTAPKQTSF